MDSIPEFCIKICTIAALLLVLSLASAMILEGIGYNNVLVWIISRINMDTAKNIFLVGSGLFLSFRSIAIIYGILTDGA